MFDSVIAAGSVVLADGSTVVTNVLNTLSTWVIIGGGLWGVFGGVTLAGGLKDHAGPQIQSGVWQLGPGSSSPSPPCSKGWFRKRVPSDWPAGWPLMIRETERMVREVKSLALMRKIQKEDERCLLFRFLFG